MDDLLTHAFSGNVEPLAARADRRSARHIPRITIHAHCETPALQEAVARAARDRLMLRAHVSHFNDGIEKAIALYDNALTPNLIIVEATSVDQAFLGALDRLAETCDTGTRVMVIGHANDIAFYRALVRRGVSEYLVAPLDDHALIDAIGEVYDDGGTRKVGQIYAFIGAKGGVGSSTVAHNVGWTMAKRFSSDVVLADLDLPFGTASLDFNLDAVQGVADAIEDESRLDEVLLDRLLTKSGDHFSVLAAPATLERPFDLSEGAFRRLLEVAQASVPYLILDLPHLWSGWVRETLFAADEIIITATPDLANLRNAKNLAALLRQTRPNDSPPKLVLNQVDTPKRPEIKIKEFAQAVELEPAIVIPYDALSFGTAANNGQMVTDIGGRKNATTRLFSDLAESIAGRKEIKGPNKAMSFRSLLTRRRRER